MAYLFLSFYLVLNLGISVHFHYCKGNLKTVSLFSAESCCPEEAAGSCSFHSSCCDNEVVQISIPSDYTNPQVQSIRQHIHSAILVPSYLLIQDRVSEPLSTTQSLDCRGAPPEAAVPVYIKLCQLTYYG
jgi:hypothetical protein